MSQVTLLDGTLLEADQLCLLRRLLDNHGISGKPTLCMVYCYLLACCIIWWDIHFVGNGIDCSLLDADQLCFFLYYSIGIL